MINIINISSYKATRIRTFSRIVYLVSGLGMATMISAYPPLKPEWIVVGSMLSIVLTLFGIIGLWPRIRVTIFGHILNNRIVHTVVFFLAGITVIMMTYFNPPVADAWYAFFSLVGALMVFDAIASTAYRLKSKTIPRKIAPAIYPLHSSHNKAA